MTRTLALCTLLLALSATPGGTLDDSPRPAFREAPRPEADQGRLGASRKGPALTGSSRRGAPNPAETRTRIVAEMVAAVLSGTASWMPAKYGPSYLAMRIPRGTVVQICGAGGCWDNAVVVDYGPSGRLHPERIADIAVGRWEDVCGLPRSRGLCLVTVDVVGPRPAMTLPPTDTGVVE